jgi:predicted lactoylglutathione lyase
LRKLFVNVAVKDLDRAVEFFTKLGFSFDPRFTDETATCMLIGEDAYAMLLTEAKFGEFTKKGIADTSKGTEAILAITAESREEVDDLVEKALSSGGSPANEPYDMGWMYGKSFNDPDGHIWEVFWMDPVAVKRARRPQQRPRESVVAPGDVAAKAYPPPEEHERHEEG